MAVAAIAFMLLAIFYYEYVPEGAYDEGPVLEILKKNRNFNFKNLIFNQPRP